MGLNPVSLLCLLLMKKATESVSDATFFLNCGHLRRGFGSGVLKNGHYSTLGLANTYT